MVGGRERDQRKEEIKRDRGETHTEKEVREERKETKSRKGRGRKAVLASSLYF